MKVIFSLFILILLMTVSTPSQSKRTVAKSKPTSPAEKPVVEVPKLATDLSIFGLKFGLPLGLQGCVGKKFEWESGEPIMNLGKEPCEQKLPYGKDDAIRAVLSRVNFPFSDSPLIVKNKNITVTLIDGNLEGVAFETHGVESDVVVLSKLKEKYGAPTVLKTNTVQNRMGATFDQYIAVWQFSNLRIAFQSVVSSIDKGLVNIDTVKGQAHRDAKSKELLKDNRPL